MARTDPQLNFRIPVELKKRIEDSLDTSIRTLNSELVYRLENSFPKPRKIIFTEINSLHNFDKSDFFESHNENVRMCCTKSMNEFFTNNPSYELIKFEFKSEVQRIHRKDQEILYGIRIWYSYPISE